MLQLKQKLLTKGTSLRTVLQLAAAIGDEETFEAVLSDEGLTSDAVSYDTCMNQCGSCVTVHLALQAEMDPASLPDRGNGDT